MEIEKLIAALEETIFYLRKSPDPARSPMPVEEIVRRLESELVKARNAKPIDINFLERLFAPTGVIQKVSIEDGWGPGSCEFRRLSMS